jgi:hypothetical protein
VDVGPGGGVDVSLPEGPGGSDVTPSEDDPELQAAAIVQHAAAAKKNRCDVESMPLPRAWCMLDVADDPTRTSARDR